MPPGCGPLECDWPTLSGSVRLQDLTTRWAFATLSEHGVVERRRKHFAPPNEQITCKAATIGEECSRLFMKRRSSSARSEGGMGRGTANARLLPFPCLPRSRPMRSPGRGGIEFGHGFAPLAIGAFKGPVARCVPTEDKSRLRCDNEQPSSMAERGTSWGGETST